MIKINMGVPKSCIECQFKTQDLEGREKCRLIKEYNDITWWKYTGKEACKRHPNCPLIECEENK